MTRLRHHCAGADLDNEDGKDDWGAGITSRCGNGRIDYESETCDDGNLDPGDGCDRRCHLEIPHGCEGVFDVASWRRWANRTSPLAAPGLRAANGKVWTGSFGAAGKVFQEGKGQLVDWDHPQAVHCTAAQHHDPGPSPGGSGEG